jgi:predicted TIM-barrel fold metal-dependent hydrolase
LHDKFAGAPFPRFYPGEFEAELQRNNVVAGVSSSATAIFHDLKRGNDENEALLRAVPRLRGYVVVDPRYLEESTNELKRLTSSDQWIGVKIHCAHAKTATNAKEMINLMAAIAEYGKPVLVHPLGADWPEALNAHAARHPGLPIIAAHAGYGDAPHPTHDAALRLADSPNVFVEFCSTYLATGAIRRGIEAVGVERVLFGSDFPLISLEYMRVAYQEAELSSDEAKSIFHVNAVRLFPALGALVEEVASAPNA